MTGPFDFSGLAPVQQSGSWMDDVMRLDDTSAANTPMVFETPIDDNPFDMGFNTDTFDDFQVG